MGTDPDPPTLNGSNVLVRRKNSEKRKEKSRYAARARRSRESEIFAEMGQLLPLPQSLFSQLDKSSIMRLAISFIKTRHLLKRLIPNAESFQGTNDDHDVSPLGPFAAMDTFLVVLSSDGHIPFISESVEKVLGLKQVDLLGMTIFEFTHPCDHNDIRDALAHKYDQQQTVNESGSDYVRQRTNSFLIRVKCTITSKGKTINLKSAAYKVIKLFGFWIKDEESNGYLCLIGEPLACSEKIDGPIGDHIFLSRHSPDMKFTDIDERFTEILGYEQKDLIGESVYNLFHALDCLELSGCFKTLFAKGQSETGYYRLLAKRGGYIWIQTQATLITDNHTQQPVSVVCVNYALSGIQNQEEIISEEQCRERERIDFATTTATLVRDDENIVELISGNQFDCKNQQAPSSFLPQLPICDKIFNTADHLLRETKSLSIVQKQRSTSCSAVPPLDQLSQVPRVVTQDLFVPIPTTRSIQPTIQPHQPNLSPLLLSTSNSPVTGNNLPTPATTTIFAPRTSDMNPGFLMPIGDDENSCGLTVLPDIEACDPEQDLTHLAPQAGDFCVPLEASSIPSFDTLSMDDLLKEMGLVDVMTTVRCGKSSVEINGAPSPMDSISNASHVSKISNGATLVEKGQKTTNNTIMTACANGKDDTLLMDRINCKNEMLLHDSNDDNSPFSEYLPCDSELLPLISSSVTQEKINCDDCDGPAMRNSPINEIETNGCGIGDNFLFNFLTNSSSKIIRSPPSNTLSVNDCGKVASGRQHNHISNDDDDPSNLCGSPSSEIATLSMERMNVESPLDNDPFLSFTNGCLLTDNFLTSNMSPHSSSNSPTFYSSSGLSESPDFALKRSSSLCDSPPPSSCNSTLTSDLDICGSFAADEDDNTACILDSSSKKTLDDPFPLLPNDDFIWDSLISSNINDLVSDGDDNILSDDKSLDDILNQDTSSSNGSSNGSTSPYSSNLAMLLQRDSHIKPNMNHDHQMSLAGKNNCNNFYSTKKNSSKGRAHSYSSFNTVSRTSSTDNRINSNFYLVQNSRTEKNDINGTTDMLAARSASQICSSGSKSSRTASNCFKLDTARKADNPIIENNGIKKYRNPGDLVYSKIAPNHVKIAHELSSNSSTVPSPKRAYLPSKNSSENNYKRMKLPSTLPTMQETSVLMNLLVNGEDVTNGYSRFQQQSYLKSSRITSKE